MRRMTEPNEVAPVYYDTKRVCKLSGGSLILGVSKDFFDYGDVIQITLWKVSDPSTKIVTTKRVSVRTGNSKCIYLNRKWGFDEGDLVVMRMKPLPGQNPEDECDDE